MELLEARLYLTIKSDLVNRSGRYIQSNVMQIM